MRPFRRFPRPSAGRVGAVTGCLALFFSLGGVGYASKVANLISGSQIKKGTIQANRLTTSARAALRGQAGAPGTPGSTGAQGLTGSQGPKGDPGLSTGPASGDLTGNFPSPQIASGAVTGAKVAPGTLTGANIQSNSITGTQINQNTLNSVDAAKLNGIPSSGYVTNGGTTFGVWAAYAAVDTATAVNNTEIMHNIRYSLRAQGMAHHLQICSDQGVNVNQSFVIYAAGVRTAATLTNSSCFAFATGGAGTTTPGDFEIVGPDGVMFGSPSTVNNSTASTARYAVMGLGFGFAAP